MVKMAFSTMVQCTFINFAYSYKNTIFSFSLGNVDIRLSKSFNLSTAPKHVSRWKLQNLNKASTIQAGHRMKKMFCVLSFYSATSRNGANFIQTLFTPITPPKDGFFNLNLYLVALPHTLLGIVEKVK